MPSCRACRYLTYAVRTMAPSVVFSSFVTGFLACRSSPLLVGVNLVSPEHDPVALRDYWLHMRFVRYMRGKFPEVRVALHAGELSLQVRD